MGTRRNLCPNPALNVNAAGWGGDGSAPARTAVSGFSRPYAAVYSSGTYIRTPAGLASLTTQYTLSIEISTPVAASGHIYIEWQRNDTSVIQYTTASYSVGANTVTRISVTDVSPTDATVYAAAIIVDGINLASNGATCSAVLMEQLPNPGFYFDGDTAGASWDGSAGASTSSLTQAMIRESGWGIPVAAASNTVTTSAAVRAGDLVVLAHCRDYYAASDMTAPSGSLSGWIQQALGDGGINAMHVKMWTAAVAADGAATLTVNCTGTADSTMYLVYWVIDSSSGTLGVRGAAGQNGTAASSSQTVPAVPSTAAGDLLLAVVASGTYASSDYSSPLTFASGGAATPIVKVLEQDNPGFATVGVFQGVLTGADAAKTAAFGTSETYGAAAVAVRSTAAAATRKGLFF